MIPPEFFYFGTFYPWITRKMYNEFIYKLTVMTRPTSHSQLENQLLTCNIVKISLFCDKWDIPTRLEPTIANRQQNDCRFADG